VFDHIRARQGPGPLETVFGIDDLRPIRLIESAQRTHRTDQVAKHPVCHPNSLVGRFVDDGPFACGQRAQKSLLNGPRIKVDPC
jgi:hypothetical protein